MIFCTASFPTSMPSLQTVEARKGTLAFESINLALTLTIEPGWTLSVNLSPGLEFVTTSFPRKKQNAFLLALPSTSIIPQSKTC